MAADAELTPTAYIQHHLSFFEKPVGDEEESDVSRLRSERQAILERVRALGTAHPGQP